MANYPKTGFEEQLIEAERNLTAAEQEIAYIQSRIDNLVERSGLKEELNQARWRHSDARTARVDAERELEVATQERYFDTSEKGYDLTFVSERTKMEYDEEQALEYAKENLPAALSLNKRVFKKVAPALGLDFVRIWTEESVSFRRKEIARRVKEILS